MPNRNIVGDYRYGYQGEYAETDPETGKVAFELRLYDPRINRWISPDPAKQYASPYLSMGNNWVSRIDSDGGTDSSYESPIFDPDGNFLGVDSEGYNGDIIVMSADKYNELTNYSSVVILDHQVALDNNLDLSALGSGNGFNSVGRLEAASKVFTHVLNNFEDIDISGLYNGSISIFGKSTYDVNSRYGYKITEGFNNPGRAGRYATNLEMKRVTVNKGYINELSTVESVQSYLGIHEWQGHAINKFSDESLNHFNAWELQKNHSTFHKLPKHLQDDINLNFYKGR